MKYLISFLLILQPILSFAQDAEEYYNMGIEKLKAGNFEEAIVFFDKSISKDKDVFAVWLSRGIANTYLREYDAAIRDYNQTLKLNPNIASAYYNRANCKWDITDYEGALADYNLAIEKDSTHINAIYSRGALYELLGKQELACADFKLAQSLGDKNVKHKIEKCENPSTTKTYSILYLTKKSKSKTYGFDSKNPIKVGRGPDGGPANQRTYLNLLRDAKEKPIKYRRVRSCCPYNTENGLLGQGMLDEYEIMYLDKNGKQVTTKVYLSFYDYEEPQILSGFQSIKKK